MDWLQRLKTIQEATPEVICDFPFSPDNALPKLSKVAISELNDIFKGMPPASLETRSKAGLTPAPVTVRQPEPNTCLTDDELRTREHCRFWMQVCHAVGMYQEQCTGTCDGQCGVYRFLELNTGGAKGLEVEHADTISA